MAIAGTPAVAIRIQRETMYPGALSEKTEGRKLFFGFVSEGPVKGQVIVYVLRALHAGLF